MATPQGPLGHGSSRRQRRWRVLTVRDEDKAAIVDLARDLVELGYDLYATPGTADGIRGAGLAVTTVYRIAEPQHPDALDIMREGRVQFIVNIPTVSGGAVRDGNMMRRLAVELNIPFVTTLRARSWKWPPCRSLPRAILDLAVWKCITECRWRGSAS